LIKHLSRLFRILKAPWLKRISLLFAAATDKGSITGTFAITLSGKFLPMQLMYGGPKSCKVQIPRLVLSECQPKAFFQTALGASKFLERSKSLSSDQKALVIFDVFKGQIIVLDILAKKNILVTTVPASMTKYYQPLDLTVNGYAKKFLAKSFNE
jgi:hypothetical protein